jgi:hypothetical protein
MHCKIILRNQNEVERLKKSIFGQSFNRKNAGMEALIEEGIEIMESDCEPSS